MFTASETSNDESSFNLLDLQAGDVIRVEFSDQDLETLQTRFQSDTDRVSYLTDRGYSAQVATLVVANMRSFSKLRPVFYVRRVVAMMETNDTSGDFTIEVNYVNRIDTDGSTDLPANDDAAEL
jgi:hypothetical protein